MNEKQEDGRGEGVLGQDDATKMRELLSTLVYWHDQGHIDESWWEAAREARNTRHAAGVPDVNTKPDFLQEGEGVKETLRESLRMLIDAGASVIRVAEGMTEAEWAPILNLKVATHNLDAGIELARKVLAERGPATATEAGRGGDQICASCRGDAGHESGGPQGWVADECTCPPLIVTRRERDEARGMAAEAIAAKEKAEAALAEAVKERDHAVSRVGVFIVTVRDIGKIFEVRARLPKSETDEWTCGQIIEAVADMQRELRATRAERDAWKEGAVKAFASTNEHLDRSRPLLDQMFTMAKDATDGLASTTRERDQLRKELAEAVGGRERAEAERDRLRGALTEIQAAAVWVQQLQDDGDRLWLRDITKAVNLLLGAIGKGGGVVSGAGEGRIET